MENRIMIIDGNSLINRAYYAMQRPMITKDGLYTQGVYGFLNMLGKLQKDHESGYIVVTFDMKAPTFRHKEYEEYKAGRKKMPPELAMQLPLLKEVLGAMNIKMLEQQGFEADDIIGTIAREAEEQGLEPLIITGDKDELQLATDKTRVIITKKGISQFEIYDHDAMVEKYGFTPQQFIDFKGLMGDQSDNIPGLPGVGEKTAQKLILEYGSVEGLLEHMDELKGKLKENVEDNAPLAVMSKRLATINTHVPMEVDFSEYRWEEPDRDKLIDVYTKLEFNSFLKKMGSGLSAEERSTAIEYKEIDAAEVIIRTKEELQQLAAALKPAACAVIKVFGNNDHRDVPVITGTSILIDNNCYYVSFDEHETRSAFITLLADKKPEFIGHDLKTDYYMLMEAGLKIFNTAFDTAIGQYVLDPGRSNYSLTVLGQEYFHQTIEEEKDFLSGLEQIDMFSDSAEQYSKYGFKWCALAAQLSVIQQQKLREEKLDSVCSDIELPLIEVMAAMEHEGFMIDRGELEKAGRDINGRIEGLTAEIYAYAGEEFNINSPQQLGPVLFEKLGLTAGKKTKKGYSTAADILENIRDEHPIVPKILEYRSLTKLRGTYIEGLLPLINRDGRIHAHFNQTVAATGRISSSDPNLQNIPIKQEEGRKLRKAFIPSADDFILMGADYSQIELRVLAHMSGDEMLREAFNSGEDIHRATAARVLGIPEDEITPLQRSRAKAVNFGVIYGMSAFGLSGEIGVSRYEAKEYIDNYFDKHAAVRKFMDEQIETCKKKGFVRTITGRKRNISEITASNRMVRQMGERLAMNSPIQGSAADIIKIAMIKVYDALREFRSRLILQVHDELIIETYKDEQDKVAELLTESMENAMDLSVELAVDLNTGSNWYQLK